MKNNYLTLSTYLEKVWPILEYCTAEIMNDKGKPVLNTDYKKHIWYIYRQIYYGFFHVLPNKKYYFSQEAEIVFKRNSKGTKLENISFEKITGEYQNIFDKGKKELLVEHMYPGTMFRLAVWEMYISNVLTIENVSQLIINKYSICWVTRTENKRLHKTKREGNLFEYYKDKKIIIVNV